MSLIETILLSGAIIFFASIIRGVTGFGLALFALPLMTLYMPVKEVIITLAIVNFIFSITHILRERNHLEKKEVFLISIFSLPGVLAGFILHKSFPEQWLVIFAGIVIISFGIAMLRGFSLKMKNTNYAISIASLIGGILAGSITIGGPIVALALAGTTIPKNRFRHAMSIFFLFSYGFAVILYLSSGMLNQSIIIIAGSSMPLLIAGLVVGVRISKGINQKSFRQLILFLLLVMGVLMIIRSFNL